MAFGERTPIVERGMSCPVDRLPGEHPTQKFGARQPEMACSLLKKCDHVFRYVTDECLTSLRSPSSLDIFRMSSVAAAVLGRDRASGQPLASLYQLGRIGMWI